MTNNLGRSVRSAGCGSDHHLSSLDGRSKAQHPYYFSEQAAQTPSAETAHNAFWPPPSTWGQDPTPGCPTSGYECADTPLTVLGLSKEDRESDANTYVILRTRPV